MKKKKHNYSKLDCCQNEQISTSRLLALKQLLDSQKSIDLAITCEYTDGGHIVLSHQLVFEVEVLKHKFHFQCLHIASETKT